MVRKIIHIDEEKCNGCGACVTACHENAIGLVDGKAKLLRDDYCDGLGDCLPTCPTGAITFVEREAAAYDEAAVKENQKKMEIQRKMMELNGGGCPGARMRQMKHEEDSEKSENQGILNMASKLQNWPVQIKLTPTNAPCFEGARLLIAADCAAYAYAAFHHKLMKGKVTLIGCPKLDDIDYSEKLTQIIANNDVKGVTIVRMEVPCCGGLEMAAKKAIQNSGKFIPWQVVTISIDGTILSE